jgi:Family of unknown function (DUF6491)
MNMKAFAIKSVTLSAKLLTGLLAAGLSASIAIAQEHQAQEEAPMVVIAKNPETIRIRTNDIYSWTSDNDTSMVLTTKRRDQFLVEFGHRCFNLHRGPRSNALITEESWLDRNGHIRLLDRNLLPSNQLVDHNGGDFLMQMKSRSNLCVVKEITALGKKPRRKPAEA